MRKLLLLLFITTFALTGRAQDSMKIAVPDSTKLTLTKVYGDVKAGLTGLGSALKVGAEHVYGIMVKQQIVNAIMWLGLLLIAFIFTVNFFKALRNPQEKWGEPDDGPTFLGLVRFIQGGCAFGLFVAGLINIEDIIMGFVNPEYGAIRDILNFVNK